MLTRHTVLNAAATGAGAVGFMLTLGWWRSAAPVAAGLLHFLPGYCLTVPGMPYGSPGMGDEDDRAAYDVFLIKRDGTTEVFTTYPAA